MSADRITRILEAPKFGDEERDTIARSLSIISSATALLGLALFVAAPWLTSEPLASMVVYAFITTFSLAGLGLMRRGHLKAATILFSITTWLVTTAALVLFGGVSGPVGSAYVLAVVIISGISGWRAGVAAGIACVISSGIMAYLEHIGRFPAPISPLSPLTAWATVASTATLAAVSLYLTSRAITHALKRARYNERLLAEHSANLERVVTERTHELEDAKDDAEAAAEAVRVREARFHALFNQAKVAIWDCDLAELRAELRQIGPDELRQADIAKLRELFSLVTVLDVNGETLSRFGAPDEDTFKAELSSLVAEESSDMLRRLFAGIRDDRRALEEQGVLQTLGGDELNVIVGISSATGASDDHLQTIVTVSDVTPLHRAQEAAQELATLRANELARVSDEVERLFYAVSHDMRAPLRNVANLAEFAREDLLEGDSGAVVEHLDKLTNRVARLETMMTDLLSFARVGRTEHPVERVDVDALLGELREGLVALPDGFELRWAEMPVLLTEKTLLSQVLLNLISNAIKHHDRREGLIEVSHQLTDGEHEFAVGDDGPGIPEKHRERVFDMFSTLKRRGDGGGSGMGLAFVHKVVTSRGGRLRVEDNSRRGAKFLFTWREARPKDTMPPPSTRFSTGALE